MSVVIVRLALRWLSDDLDVPLTPAAFLLGVLLLLAMAGVVIGVVVHG